MDKPSKLYYFNGIEFDGPGDDAKRIFCAMSWAKDPEHFRQLTGASKNATIFRTCPPESGAPAGYKLTGTLACDPAVRLEDAKRTLLRGLRQAGWV
jgi:hypothetical protein